MSRFDQLSGREWEVIDQLLQGKSNQLIASALDVTESTVEFHLKNIYTKIQVRSRIELILALWKTTGKASIEELGYSTVDSMENGIENGGKQAAYQYGRIRKTMRLYRIVLGACVIAILLPLTLLAFHSIRRPDSIIIWRGILTWLLPAVSILILLIFFPRMSYRPLANLAFSLFLGLLFIGFVTNLRLGLVFAFINLRFWLLPYLLGAGGILIAAKYRAGESDPATRDAEL